ncbi:putative oxidoreductase CzcO [Pirellulimonas nuda]|uniref:Putative oxidoreductase CzcO n=1 Tax=Pirellulimonas nuda TaxID=2528009 RepID=A0A518D637_9BACT|nr:NAD(P)-binding domain-containing protein [Pirellulimonas nuda]QDU86938.1 putative oxidoreductase CzcO [Pirellulimonas nuda]
MNAASQQPGDAQQRPATGVCVVGAGSSGLAVVRWLAELGIPCRCFERQPALGGNWRYGSPASSVCRSTHLISSKRLTQYRDFPMPAEWPQYPSHALALEYLERYAHAFGLHQHIAYGTGIERVCRLPDGGWGVTPAGGQQQRFAALVIANGHNHAPRLPAWAGRFTGEGVHSGAYRTPDMLAGKRVLVVGGGNSGCDIAVESAQHASRTVLSLRRGYHLLPKFWRGVPIDVVGEAMLRWRMPLAVRRQLARLVAYLMMGDPRTLGIPKPDHKLFESHPVINSQLMYALAHGDIAVAPDVQQVDGQRITFADGRSETFDLVVYATGFEITAPFVDAQELNWRGGRPDLYLNVFHPLHDDLFVAGLIQPDSGQWGLVDRQAELIARYLHGLHAERPAATRFRDRKHARRDDLKSPVKYLDSPRHLLEVEHHSYARRLEREIQKLR